MNDQIAERRSKLEKLRALGVDPYGGRFANAVPLGELRRRGESLSIEAGQVLDGNEARCRAAGRIALLRDIGRLIFLTVRDAGGQIQFALSKKSLAETDWQVAKLLDLGDIVGIEGRLGRTKTGELTVFADHLRILSKCLRPPPEKRLGLTDVEQRYRKRYVDLFANPDSRQVFVTRSRVVEYMRARLAERGFLEVETPVLQPIYGGAAARPFITHHNTLDLDLYLRISPELYLKRCLVGGLDRVYEFARCFRNEGISPRHNPEFTMLELYQAWGDYHDMMELCELLIGGAARDVVGRTQIRFGEQVIDYTTPWPRRRYEELFREHVGVEMRDTDTVRQRFIETFRAGYRPEQHDGRSIEQLAETSDQAVLVNELFEHFVEPHLIHPTFVLDYPAALCPLTKRHPEQPDLALRFELYIAGLEIANAYSELNDPDVQRANFRQQIAGEGDETMRVMDEDFIEALEYGMPPAGGLGVGIDRICMLLSSRTSIRDVILFPLQRPQRQAESNAEAQPDPHPGRPGQSSE